MGHFSLERAHAPGKPVARVLRLFTELSGHLLTSQLEHASANLHLRKKRTCLEEVFVNTWEP